MIKKDTFYEDRLHEIKSNLTIGDKEHMGGTGLKDILVHCLLCDNTLDIESLFASIAQLYREKERTIKDGAIFPVKFFEKSFQPKEHMVYACLDNELKFRMLHYGEEDWKEAFYVFPYIDTSNGWKISLKELE